MIIDNPQPQPGPSPTPTPKPCVALKIISISTQGDGSAVLVLPEPIGPLHVSKEYMQECQPNEEDYYVRYDDPEMKSCLSAYVFESLFPQ